MAFVAGDELLELLPSNTAVTEEVAQEFIDAAIARLDEIHFPDGAPENAITRDLVMQLSFARALKRHYLKGEGQLEVPAAEEDIVRAEAAFAAYASTHISESILGSDVGAIAYVEESPF